MDFGSFFDHQPILQSHLCKFEAIARLVPLLAASTDKDFPISLG